MIKRSVRGNRRYARVRFMLGGVEQAGQGVAGQVPHDSRAPPSFFVHVRACVTVVSHLPITAVRCTIPHPQDIRAFLNRGPPADHRQLTTDH